MDTSCSSGQWQPLSKNLKKEAASYQPDIDSPPQNPTSEEIVSLQPPQQPKILAATAAATDEILVTEPASNTSPLEAPQPPNPPPPFPSPTGRRRRVRFSAVRIRSYKTTIGDNPCCSLGPPLALDWEYKEDTRPPGINIDAYEDSKAHYNETNTYRKKVSMMLLSNTQRCARLFQAGYSRIEMKEAVKQIRRDQIKRGPGSVGIWDPVYWVQEIWLLQLQPLLYSRYERNQDEILQKQLKRVERRVHKEHQSQASSSIARGGTGSVGISRASSFLSGFFGDSQRLDDYNDNSGFDLASLEDGDEDAAGGAGGRLLYDPEGGPPDAAIAPFCNDNVSSSASSTGNNNNNGGHNDQNNNNININNNSNSSLPSRQHRIIIEGTDLISSCDGSHETSSSGRRVTRRRQHNNKSSSSGSGSGMSPRQHQGSGGDVIEEEDDEENESSTNSSSYGIQVDTKQHDKAMEIKLYSLRRPHMRAFHAAWFSFFIAFFSWFSITPLLGEIKESLDLSNDDIWMSSLVGTSGTIIMRILMGPLCDRFGARLCMGFILISAAIPTALTGLIQSSEGLAMVRLFIGIGGSSFVACQSWTTDMFTREVSGTANALVAGWGNLGGGFAQLVMGSALFPLFRLFFGDDNDLEDSELAWRTVFVVPAMLSIVTGVAVILYCDDSPTGSYRDRLRNETLVLANPMESLCSATRNWNVWILTLQYACCFGVEVTMTNATALYFKDEFGQSTVSAAGIASIFGLMNLFARGVGGFCSDWLQLHYGVRGRLLFQTTTLILEGLIVGFFAYAESLAGSIVTLVFLSIMVQSAEGSTFGIVPYVDRRFTGSVVGLVGSGGSMGAAIFSVFFVYLHYRPAFVTMGAFAVCSSFLSFLLHTEKIAHMHEALALEVSQHGEAKEEEEEEDLILFAASQTERMSDR